MVRDLELLRLTGLAGAALSANLEVLYGVALFVALVILPDVVTLMKGQYIAFVVGALTLGLVWIIVSLRLARPTSLWARNFYSAEKRARARARYM
jgi:hypothetical protein